MRPGDTAPDLAFHTADGESVRLSSFLTSDHLLVVFLRHLA
jgi:hypothetical protein